MQDFDKISPVVLEEMKTVKIKDGCRWPYLLIDPNHFRADKTRPLGEHLRQVLKKSDQWPQRRCDYEIVTVLSKGHLAF